MDLAALLRGGRQTNFWGRSPARFGDIDFRAASLDGYDVSPKKRALTRKEFDLLQYLASNPNTPIPHRKLLQAVWGPDYGNDVVYLRVFISQIRKKIELEPAQPRYILTEPCVGYQFHIPQRPAPADCRPARG